MQTRIEKAIEDGLVAGAYISSLLKQNVPLEAATQLTMTYLMGSQVTTALAKSLQPPKEPWQEDEEKP